MRSSKIYRDASHQISVVTIRVLKLENDFYPPTLIEFGRPKKIICCISGWNGHIYRNSVGQRSTRFTALAEKR
jgi:hypothetical protein